MIEKIGKRFRRFLTIKSQSRAHPAMEKNIDTIKSILQNHRLWIMPHDYINLKRGVN